MHFSIKHTMLANPFHLASYCKPIYWWLVCRWNFMNFVYANQTHLFKAECTTKNAGTAVSPPKYYHLYWNNHLSFFYYIDFLALSSTNIIWKCFCKRIDVGYYCWQHPDCSTNLFWICLKPISPWYLSEQCFWFKQCIRQGAFYRSVLFVFKDMQSELLQVL